MIRRGESFGSLTRRPELDLLNVFKRDEAWHPILGVDDHKGWDIWIHLLRNRRQVNEVGMMNREPTARTGDDNKGRKCVWLDDIRNLFPRHWNKGTTERQYCKQNINLLLPAGATDFV